MHDQGADMRKRCRRCKWLMPHADLEGRDAIKLFFASPVEVASKIALPEDKWRREWVDGWDSA